MITVKNLSKQYSGTSIFEKLSIEIPRNKITVLQGHSGCGKSTLLKCISFLMSWDNGTISIENKTVTGDHSQKKKDREKILLHADISAVFQQLYLWPHLTCAENIKLAAPEFDCTLLAGKLKIDGVLGKYPNQISLGQAQRVAYIRSIASKPKYQLLDEVTSALDHKSTRLMSELINKKKNEGTGILVITHSREFINQLNTDKIMDMENGKLTEIP